MKRSLLLIFFSIILCGLFLSLATNESIDAYHGRTETFHLPSMNVGGDFKIVTYLPKGYDLPENRDRSYPVVYQLNGNYHGRTSAILAASLYGRGVTDTPVMVVSIGYDFKMQQDRRGDDYVYVAPVDFETLTFREKDGAGGGIHFLAFMRSELIPYIDKHYRTDNKTYGRTLMGHSLAGYFTLLALLKDHGPEQPLEDAFKNFVAAAPLVVNRWHYLYALEKQMGRHNWASLRANLFLAVSNRDENMLSDHVIPFSRTISKRKYPGLHLKLKEYKKLRHIPTATPAFKDGLTFIFGK